MKHVQNIWLFIRRHKYAVVSIAFLLIIGVLDENCLLRRAAHHQEIASLKNEIERYTKEFDESSKKLEELNNNPEAIEKIARERYMMKTEDEDFFIMEKDLDKIQ